MPLHFSLGDRVRLCHKRKEGKTKKEKRESKRKRKKEGRKEGRRE